MNTNVAAAEATVNSKAAQDGLVAEQEARPVTTRYCACGCQEPMVKNSNAEFRMGHDAKFKSKAILLVVNPLDDEKTFDAPPALLQIPELNQTEDTLEESGRTVEEYLSAKAVIERRKECVSYVAVQMGRPALAEKIEAGVNNWVARESGAKRDRSGKKAKPEVATEWVDGTTKVGRWEYKAHRNTKSGAVEYTTKQGDTVIAMAGSQADANFKASA